MWLVSLSATESSVTLIDVDGDGLDDVLIGVVQLEQYMNAHKLLPNLTMREVCTKLGFQYPCQGQVVALRGYDGMTLWQTWLRSGVIFVNCHDADANLDGKPDCIFTGRESSVQAVDLKTGKTLWVIDAEEKTWSSHFVRSWNVYRAVGVEDADGDGVKDIVVTHGGDPARNPEDHNREAGRVILLSGATGKPLGRYLEIPDSKETYMSPVIHKTANGSSCFLFGSGGETVPGDLMMISEQDLYHLMGMGASQPPSRVESGNHNTSHIEQLGMLVDVTGDGTLDILMTAFEGVIILFDGETFQEVWRQQFPGMESYSTPAPGQFDGDGVIDFMVTCGEGAWPTYSSAKVYILSGEDGHILWEANSRTVQMYSDLSLRTTQPQDMFLFRLIGRKASSHNKTVANSPHGTASGRRKKRHQGGHEADEGKDEHIPLDTSPENVRKMCESNLKDYEEDHITCSDDLTGMEDEIFVMDSRQAQKPLLIHSTMPEMYKYNYSVEAGEPHCHQLTSGRKDQVSMCVVRIPKGSTGAVGDVNGDGKPDLILLDRLVADTITDRFSYLDTRGNLVLSRIILSEAIQSGVPTELQLGHLDQGNEGKNASDVEFLPDKAQPWRQFMGSAGDGVYRTEP
ncbi:hypothetical protein BaRGS_00036312 [Batillaria attramentaria]|uniref:FAM234A/B beta-propeller domain-containing protein n=1 Tax=Batillaria attramentaria TaxID=370345 RepID=A0ABD0JCA9_9CAEN